MGLHTDSEQQMVRYIVIQYKDELLSLQADELASDARTDNNVPRLARQRSLQLGAKRSGGDKMLYTEQEKDEVASDLLAVLQKIPIEVIGESEYRLGESGGRSDGI
jgi:hypothetical protein